MTTEALEVERLRAELSSLRVQRARERARDGWAEAERLRGVLARIEALVWYEPDDEDDLVEAVRAMVRERDEARAEAKAWRTERDEARAEAESGWGVACDALAEVERLRGDLARCREVQRATAEGWRHEVAEVASIIGSPAHTAELAACVRAEVERLGRERDEARAQVERLRAALAAQAQRADE